MSVLINLAIVFVVVTVLLLIMAYIIIKITDDDDFGGPSDVRDYPFYLYNNESGF
jgi:hypothetical protein